jgi:hypothetical protein
MTKSTSRRPAANGINTIADYHLSSLEAITTLFIRRVELGFYCTQTSPEYISITT